MLERRPVLWMGMVVLARSGRDIVGVPLGRIIAGEGAVVGSGEKVFVN